MLKNTNQFTFDINASICIWEQWCKENKVIPLVSYKKSTQLFYFMFLEGKYKGLVGKTYWASIKRGSKLRFSCLTLASINMYMKNLGYKIGIRFTTNYVGNRRGKNKFIVTTGKYKGCEGEITINELETITSIDSRSLTIKGKKQYFDNKATMRKCEILEYPDKYKIKADKKMKVKDCEGNIHFLHVQDFFERDSVLRYSYMSEGEKIVSEVLNELSIKFIKEKSFINSNGVRQRFDFYFQHNNKLCAIEYNGRQHYTTTNNDFFGRLKNIQERDELKRQYCINNNIKLLEIPYTQTSKETIKCSIINFLFPNI